MTKDISELRCVHRHSITSHPACFVSGNIKWPDAKTFEKFSKEPWWKYPGYKIGYLDIETDGLKVDFSTMLTWCIKEKDGPVYSSIITRDELISGTPDCRLVSNLLDTLKQFQIIITYYGTGFDVPFVRAKSLYYGLEFPVYGEIYHHDLYYVVRNKLHLSRNSLDSACDFLGIPGKTHIDKESWRKAKYGDADALNYVLEHNIGDVVILEKLHERLNPFVRTNKSSI